MSVKQEQGWITGEEFAREHRRLMDADVPEDAPEFRALMERKQERDDYLYERFGKQFITSHRGQWVAISPTGDVIIRPTASTVLAASRREFGPGNASIRKLDEFPGHQFFR